MLLLIVTFWCSFSIAQPFYSDQIKNGCNLDVNKDLTFKHPLILKKDANEFIYPQISGGIHFNAKEVFRLACPGNFLAVAGHGVQEVEAQCISGNAFIIKDISDTNYKFQQLTCDNYPLAKARGTGKTCSENYTEAEIGFETRLGFVRTITTCFDNKTFDSLYSEYNLTASIGDHQENVPRPSGFQESNFYPGLHPTPSVLYTKKDELFALSKLLKSETLAKKYIKLHDDKFFLSRGHLTANGDFVYGSQQHATFFYINVAPQWQIFNGGNWEQLEFDVRTYASTYKKNLIVYTGTWGNAMLPDVNNELTKLFLYVGKNGDNRIRVPEIYWKILYDPETREGTAFIGHNNPYNKNVADNVICESVCDKITWLKWEPTDIQQGYSYCCDYYDFKRIVTYAPDLSVQDLLI